MQGKSKDQEPSKRPPMPLTKKHEMEILQEKVYVLEQEKEILEQKVYKLEKKLEKKICLAKLGVHFEVKFLFRWLILAHLFAFLW